jgi:Mn-dependent DtxR family transcriptional regulator
VLDERADASVIPLAKALDAHPITTDQRCYELQREGYVRQTSTGVYAITEFGEAHLGGPEE